MTFKLETERLILTVPSMQDYDNLLSLRTDPVVMASASNEGSEFGSGKPQAPEQVKEHIELAQGYFDEYGLCFFCVFEKSTGNFIGQAGLFHWCYKLDQPDIELAYRLFEKYWDKGYGTELAKALIKWGLNDRKLPRIIAPVHPDNIRSVNVLKKAGMKFDGKINHKGVILNNYVIKNEEKNSL